MEKVLQRVEEERSNLHRVKKERRLIGLAT
jgi:hypothetical protein